MSALPSPTPDDLKKCARVAVAYQLFFRRDPEDLAVQMEKIGLSQRELTLLFLHSDEFSHVAADIVEDGGHGLDRPGAPIAMVNWVSRLTGTALPAKSSRAQLLLAVLADPAIDTELDASGRGRSLETLTATLQRCLDRQASADVTALEAHPLGSWRGMRASIGPAKDGALEGWLIGAEAATTWIEVAIDGETLVRLKTDRPRSDVARRPDEPQALGFLVPLPAALFDDEEHRVTVLVDGVEIAARVVALVDGADAALRHGSGRLNLHRLFDAEYYSAQLGYHPDDALDHYRREGWRDGLNPHPLFDTLFYCRQRPQAKRFDPLYDFMTLGQFTTASTHPLLTYEGYVERMPGVLDARIHPLIHYLEIGHADTELRLPFFDTGFYLGQQPVFRRSETPLSHYLTEGWRVGLKPHREFDPVLFVRVADLPRNVEPLTFFACALHDDRSDVEAPSSPSVSIVILNLNKWLMTAQCVFFLRRYTRGEAMDILIADNGSEAGSFKQLCDHIHGCRIIRLPRNLGFGEANNLATEVASSDLLLLLNNDVFVLPDWFAPLRARLFGDAGTVAVGPKMISGDGRLQEAGGMVSADGGVIQFGKRLSAADPMFNTPRAVDYISAAALLLRRQDFIDVLGFDLCWDPAYYEDVDLCLKLTLDGRKIWYEPSSTVVHLENATSSDPSLNLGLHNIVEVNRLKFVRRWGDYLSGGSKEAARQLIVPRVPEAPPRGERMQLALFTPFPITPGGGERYLLSIADQLADVADVTLFTLQPTSRLRLRTMARELQLSLDHVTPATWQVDNVGTFFDVFVSIGNEAIPFAPAIGRKNYYICQFPFPMQPDHYTRDWNRDQGYDGVWVYSEFCREAYRRTSTRIGRPALPCHIVAPPVPQMPTGAARGDAIRILNVGRFHPGGHCKRQDSMIDAFIEMAKATDRPIELHFAGALGTDGVARDYLIALQRAALHLPIYFHLNPLPSQIEDLYRSSTIYWHATGMGEDVEMRPERFEHFGITILEAMSAGCIPVVLRYGGPGEILSDRVDGFLIADAAGLARTTLEVLALDNDERDRIARNARRRAADFSPERFRDRLIELLDQQAKVAVPVQR